MRVGFRPGEQYAMHCRRRFRLTPPKIPTPNMPQVDPSLWIVQYGPTENERILTNQIPYDPHVHAIMNARAQLQRAGQITRKEFMLSDRVNWPQIPLPREARGQPVYATPGHGRPVPQQMAYPPHSGGAVGPPAKRPRHGPVPSGPHHQPMMGAMVPMENAYDDEEDTSRGDMFDNLTPREVSKARYVQNHEWMEELLSSPYALVRVTHSDLGLGLAGELRTMTEGIFEAQGVSAIKEAPKKPYAGRLDPTLADEFRKRVAAKVETSNAEIDAMTSEHEKTVAKFKANAFLKHAEQELRVSADETGPEFWRLEGRLEESDEAAGAGRWPQKHGKRMEDIVAGVGVSLGKTTHAVRLVSRVHDGGYQEPVPDPVPEPVVQASAPTQSEQTNAGANSIANLLSMSRQPSQAGSQHSGILIGDSDMDMGGTAAGLLDQMHTGFSSTSTPLNNFPTPQPHFSAVASSVATPAALGVASPQNAAPPAIPEEAMQDVTTGSADAQAPAAGPTIASPDQGSGSDEWVVVPPGGISPDLSSAAAKDSVQAPSDAATPKEGQPLLLPPPTSKPGSAVPTPAAATDPEPMAFDGDHNDFSSLGDLDTAGDALASYDTPALDGTGGSLGDGLDLHVDMDEDSAFGDAFRQVHESREGDGDRLGL